jgi:hypothetical protein
MLRPSGCLMISCLFGRLGLIFVGINDFDFPGSLTKGASFFPLHFGTAIPNFYVSFPFTVMTFFVVNILGCLGCLGCIHI